MLDAHFAESNASHLLIQEIPFPRFPSLMVTVIRSVLLQLVYQRSAQVHCGYNDSSSISTGYAACCLPAAVVSVPSPAGFRRAHHREFLHPRHPTSRMGSRERRSRWMQARGGPRLCAGGTAMGERPIDAE